MSAIFIRYFAYTDLLHTSLHSTDKLCFLYQETFNARVNEKEFDVFEDSSYIF